MHRWNTEGIRLTIRCGGKGKKIKSRNNFSGVKLKAPLPMDPEESGDFHIQCSERNAIESELQ